MSKIITDVPEGWKIQRLKHVCKLRKRTKLPPLREIANIPMALIPEDGLYANYILRSIDDIKSGDICKEGDILLAGITPSFENGKQGIVPQLPSKYAITSTEAFPIICYPDVETHFIFHFLKYEFTRRIIASRMEGSTGRQRVPADVLMNFHIPVPPLIEQRGIVEVLGTVDECIRLTDAVIERAEELKRGLMQQLLTRGIGHTEYKNTPLGKIPTTWNILNLGDTISSNIDYRGKTPPYTNSGIPCISAENVNDGRITHISKYIAKDIYETWTTRGFPQPNDIIITTEAPVGEIALFPSDQTYLLTRRVMALQPNKEIILNHFLKNVLMSFYVQKQFAQKTRGTTVPRILKPELFNTKLLVPKINEQKKISEILKNIEDKIIQEETIQKKLMILKQGLMQTLLSGNTRVELREDGLHRIRDG